MTDEVEHFKVARETLPGNDVTKALGLLFLLGENATPGPWTNTHGLGDFGWGVTDKEAAGSFGVETEDSDQGRYDSSWIAAASPSVAAPLAGLMSAANSVPHLTPLVQAVAEALLSNDVMLSHLPEHRDG